MLLDSHTLPLQETSLLFQRRVIPLHAMVVACGHAEERSAAYDWDGLKRGGAELALIQYTLSGRGALEHEGHHYDIFPGQAMLLHFPHANRYRLPQNSSHWRFLYACLHGREVMRVWPEIEKKHGPLIELAPSSEAILSLEGLVRRAIEGRLSCPFDASACAYALTMHLARTILAQPQEETVPDAIQRAIAFCETHMADNIGVDDIAGAAGMSRYHFSRLFKRATGAAPAAYVQELRITEAIRLLSDPRLSITEIAPRCGFRDLNYFCRVFRNATGLSPGQYRRSGMSV
jgi:AraC family transcriptional regulator